MKAITTMQAGVILKGDGGNTGRTVALLKKHGVKPIYEHKTPTGRSRYLWGGDEVHELAKKLAPPPAPEHAPPQKQLTLDDEAVSGLVRKLDGLPSYVCRLGETQAKQTVEISTVQSQQRLILEGLNRLLTAANLQPVRPA